MKRHISQVLNLGTKKHKNYDFVDVNLNHDQELFIDPCLLGVNHDKWCRKAVVIVNSYFEQFYEAYRKSDYSKKHELLSNCHELNHTKLGYGNGRNGHGNTPEGLIEDFKPLEEYINEIDTISESIDICVLIVGFNEDGLSDMLTNILHLHLNDYTLEILDSYGIKPNSQDTFYFWNEELLEWKQATMPCYKIDNKKILLTPKRIVRRRYLFSANHFLQSVILENDKMAGMTIDADGKATYTKTKKELKSEIPRKSKNWRYDYNHYRSVSDSGHLQKYHNIITSLYVDRGLDDSTLDRLIY